MCFRPNNIQSKVMQNLALSSTALRFVKYDHVGVTLFTDLADNSIGKQMLHVASSMV